MNNMNKNKQTYRNEINGRKIKQNYLKKKQRKKKSREKNKNKNKRQKRKRKRMNIRYVKQT